VNRALLLLPLSLLGCATTEPFVWPAPDGWSQEGPGIAPVQFTDDLLWSHCAYLDGGPEDADHHNLLVPWDGWLVLPWAPEYSGGGLSFFDISEPCAPEKVGEGWDRGMRESHSLAFSTRLGRYVAVDYHGGIDFETEVMLGGVQIWDIRDVAAPRKVVDVPLPDYLYPDAYARVTLSVSWQGTWLFAAGADNGVYVIDTTDPETPEYASMITFDPPLRVAAFHVVGNLGIATSAEGSRVVMVDISDPLDPSPIPGGDFDTRDDVGEITEYYFSNLAGRWALFARKEGGGGPMVYDIADPSTPTRLGGFHTPDGNGGYVFRQHEHLFVGDSNFAEVVDFSDPAAPQQIGRANLQGDLDTATPFGNVVLLSVDEEAVPGQATAVVPWAALPDARGPAAEFTSPPDGAVWVAPGSRVGVSFDEMVEPVSVFEGSFRVATADGEPVAGTFTVQEATVNFAPDAPLAADTSYVVTLPAGGIADVSGNRTATEFSFGFSTGAGR
jgi:hypothetical protein